MKLSTSALFCDTKQCYENHIKVTTPFRFTNKKRHVIDNQISLILKKNFFFYFYAICKALKWVNASDELWSKNKWIKRAQIFATLQQK